MLKTLQLTQNCEIVYIFVKFPIVLFCVQALIWAACKGNLQSVQALLEAGVDTEKTCMECYTAKDHADHAERSSVRGYLN